MDTPTIYDVSRLSGVSTATVSRTFTTPDRVRESTRRRVYAAAEALHYQPSAIARAMARQQTDKIAFLICKEGATILAEFYASICEGVMRRANGTNYQLLISTAEEWTRTAQSKQIEGVILAGNAQADLISEFQRQNIPVVLVNNRAAGFDLPCIVADEAGGVSGSQPSDLRRTSADRHPDGPLLPLRHQCPLQCVSLRYAGKRPFGG